MHGFGSLIVMFLASPELRVKVLCTVFAILQKWHLGPRRMVIFCIPPQIIKAK